ncbi:hypothetical protein JB92DRAFT_2824815 [Gautieria morchelliformis]|nr:hypothetical protein JB92DRAFT_2824815 [Gautieria morchelliformis]
MGHVGLKEQTAVRMVPKATEEDWEQKETGGIASYAWNKRRELSGSGVGWGSSSYQACVCVGPPGADRDQVRQLFPGSGPDPPASLVGTWSRDASQAPVKRANSTFLGNRARKRLTALASISDLSGFENAGAGHGRMALSPVCQRKVSS